MNKQMDEFISVGMKKYKQASATLVSFGKEVERRLQGILSERPVGEWGSFLPERVRPIKSTKYWSEYPLLNAKIDGRIGSDSVKVMIAVNWSDSEHEYPFYYVTLEPVDPYRGAMSAFTWTGDVKWNDSRLELHPHEDDFELARDFGVLLDELVRFFNSSHIQSLPLA